MAKAVVESPVRGEEEAAVAAVVVDGGVGVAGVEG